MSTQACQRWAMTVAVSIVVVVTVGCDGYAAYDCRGRLTDLRTGGPLANIPVYVVPRSKSADQLDQAEAARLRPSIGSDVARTDPNGRFTDVAGVSTSWPLFAPPPPEVERLSIWIRLGTDWHVYDVPVARSAQQERASGYRAVRLPEIGIDGGGDATSGGVRFRQAGFVVPADGVTP